MPWRSRSNQSSGELYCFPAKTHDPCSHRPLTEQYEDQIYTVCLTLLLSVSTFRKAVPRIYKYVYLSTDSISIRC